MLRMHFRMEIFLRLFTCHNPLVLLIAIFQIMSSIYIRHSMVKQSPRAWFSRLSSRLVSLGFKGCKSDPSLFIYRTSTDLILFLIYVDDIIVTGPSISSISRLIRTLLDDFALKDLGPLHFFLGVEALKTDQHLYISQRRYILDLLQKINMHLAKPVSFPIASSTSLRKQYFINGFFGS